MKFSSGSVAGDEQCVEIVIIDDDCKEDNESFVFAICAGGDPAVHIDDFYSNVYIIDQDGKNFVHLIVVSFFFLCFCLSQLYRCPCQLGMVVKLMKIMDTC